MADHIATTSDNRGVARLSSGVAIGMALSVPKQDTSLMTSFQNRMGRNQYAIFEDAYLLSQCVDFYRPSPRRIWNAVLVATDADHAIAGDPSFQAQH